MENINNFNNSITFGSQGPQLVQSLASRNIVKIAAHSDGHHYLALSANGEVFSWGCGDGGRLGHGDTVYVIIIKKKSNI